MVKYIFDVTTARRCFFITAIFIGTASAAPYSLFNVPQYMSKSGPWGKGQCTVLLYADGLGDFSASSPALRDLGRAWWRGTTIPPSGDTSAVVLGLRGGCKVPLWKHLTRGGAVYGLVTSKCVDDGTSAGFLVTPENRYDLTSTSRAIASLHPPPYLLSGGFSRSLWEQTSGASFVEFDSPGASAFGETCEYPSADSFAERTRRAVHMGMRASTSGGFFLNIVDTQIDVAAHGGNSNKVNTSVQVLRQIIDETTEILSANCTTGWRIIVTGSHATGGVDGNSRRHSPDGTPVPVFISGIDKHQNDITDALRASQRDSVTYKELAHIIAPELPCGREQDLSSPEAVYFKVRRPDDLPPAGKHAPIEPFYYDYRHVQLKTHRWSGTLYFFFFSVIGIVGFLYLVLPSDEDMTS